MLPSTRLIQSIWFAGEIFPTVTHVHNTPPRPGLFLSGEPEFFERGEFFRQNFLTVGPSKKFVRIFWPDYYTAPVLSLKPASRSSGCVFDIFAMMTRSVHHCWHVRTNKCVQTNICKTSVFVFSVRNVYIFGRILIHFTGLLWTNTVAAKRDLLTERTGFGKSVSVALQKKGPQEPSRIELVYGCVCEGYGACNRYKAFSIIK